MFNMFTPRKLIPTSLFIVLVTTFIAPAAQAKTQTIDGGKSRATTSVVLSNLSLNEGQTNTAEVKCPTATYDSQIFRIGDYGTSEIQEQWSATSQKCGSPLSIVQKFAPGVYVIKILDSEGFDAYSVFIVKSSVHTKGVASIPFMTLFAYNKVDGANAYKSPKGFAGRAKEISFASPIDYASGLDKFQEYVFPVVREIEKSHLNISYVADFDINDNPSILDNHTAYISMGHDEYWTDAERTAVIEARNKGTNLVFLGANVAYWNVRLSGAGNQRRLYIYKNKKLDPDKSNPSILFAALGKPESQLTGLDYTCFPAHGTLEIKAPQSFIFKGAPALTQSDLHSLVGPEVDQYKKRKNKFQGTIHVLAEAKVSCAKSLGRQVTGLSDLIYGISPNGAGTISIGSMAWTSVGLRAHATTELGQFARIVTTNILTAVLQGPLSKYEKI